LDQDDDEMGQMSLYSIDSSLSLLQCFICSLISLASPQKSPGIHQPDCCRHTCLPSRLSRTKYGPPVRKMSRGFETSQPKSSFDVEVLYVFSIGLLLLLLLLLDLGLFTPELHLLCKQLFWESNIVCRCMTDVHKERGTCKTVCINL
jgi:hypothetical protein